MPEGGYVLVRLFQRKGRLVMIQIVMKPDYAIKPKEGENCYGVMFNGEDIGFRVFGRKASHAEEKLMVIFREQLNEKVVDYDLEAYRKSKGEGRNEEGSEGVPKASVSPTKVEKADEALLPGLEMA